MQSPLLSHTSSSALQERPSQRPSGTTDAFEENHGLLPSRSMSRQNQHTESDVAGTGEAARAPRAGDEAYNAVPGPYAAATGVPTGNYRHQAAPSAAAPPHGMQHDPPLNGAFPRPLQRVRTAGAQEDPDNEFGYPVRSRRSATATICFCARGYIGNTIVCYECRGERRAKYLVWPLICNFGPDWPCNMVTYALVTLPSVAFLAFVAPTLHVAVILFDAVLLLGSLLMLTLTACSDPGVVRAQSREQLEAQKRDITERGRMDEYTLCQFCNILRDSHVTHCYDCNTCVLELDHHCPWMGKCIGKNNLYFFYGFLWSILFLILFTAGGMFAWIIGKAAHPAG